MEARAPVKVPDVASKRCRSTPSGEARAGSERYAAGSSRWPSSVDHIDSGMDKQGIEMVELCRAHGRMLRLSREPHLIDFVMRLQPPSKTAPPRRRLRPDRRRRAAPRCARCSAASNTHGWCRRWRGTWLPRDHQRARAHRPLLLPARRRPRAAATRPPPPHLLPSGFLDGAADGAAASRFPALFVGRPTTRARSAPPAHVPRQGGDVAAHLRKLMPRLYPAGRAERASSSRSHPSSGAAASSELITGIPVMRIMHQRPEICLISLPSPRPAAAALQQAQNAEAMLLAAERSGPPPPLPPSAGADAAPTREKAPRSSARPLVAAGAPRVGVALATWSATTSRSPRWRRKPPYVRKFERRGTRPACDPDWHRHREGAWAGIGLSSPLAAGLAAASSNRGASRRNAWRAASQRAARDSRTGGGPSPVGAHGGAERGPRGDRGSGVDVAERALRLERRRALLPPQGLHHAQASSSSSSSSSETASTRGCQARRMCQARWARPLA